jgi:division protein CdvB (Snf7/Vps24/ESCRT-III family)
LQNKKVLSNYYPKEDKMTTFTLITKNGATVNVSITEEQGFAFVKAEVEKLQEKLDELNGLDSFESSEIAVKSLKAKLNKLEEDGKLAASYTYEELKTRTSSKNELKEMMIEAGLDVDKLYGSAYRAYTNGKKAFDKMMSINGNREESINFALEFIGGKKSLWFDIVCLCVFGEDEQ